MLITAVVVRLLDASDGVLGWAEAPAEARGDGCLWAQAATTPIGISQAGVVAALSVHWCDVHLEQRYPMPAVSVVAGAIYTVQWPGPALRVGVPPVSLPPVTVGSVVIGIPVGQMGAAGR